MRPAEVTSSGEPLERTVLAVNGRLDESNLRSLTVPQLAERAGDAEIQFVASDEAISLTGGPTGRSGLWKWAIAAVLACLLGEMFVAGHGRRDVSEVAT